MLTRHLFTSVPEKERCFSRDYGNDNVLLRYNNV